MLEVVLALAILTAAVAVLGELVRQGLRSAQLARDLSQAQILCESTIYQIESGMLPPQPVQKAPVENAPGWLYSIEPATTGMGGTGMTGGGGTGAGMMSTGLTGQAGSGMSGQGGLLCLTVTVEQSPDRNRRPTKFSAVRWLRDPSLVLAQQAAQQSVLPTTNSSMGNATGSPTSAASGMGVY